MTDSAARRLRMAVVGIGHLGKHHVRLLSAMPNVELVAAVDLVEDRARQAAEGTGAEILTDYRKTLHRVEAAVVAVPTVDHLAVAGEFLDRGIPVLVEKPIAGSLVEADAMIARAERGGAMLAVGHSERFNPAFRAALPVLAHPRFIEVHRLSGFPDRSLDIDVIFDVMIHDLDIALAVDRSEVASVEAVGVPVLTSKIDIANARVKFASGCVANITASRISRDKIRKVRCFQPDRYVSVDYAAQELEVWRLEAGSGDRPSIAGGPVSVSRGEPLALELSDFVEAILTGRPPGVTGADGRSALALATRVAAAISSNA